MQKHVFFRHSGLLAGYLIVALVMSGPVAGQTTEPPADAFQRLNDTAITLYQDAKHRYLAAADPVVIVGRDSVLIRQNGEIHRVEYIPPNYQLLKAVGHVPRSVWAVLRPAIDGLDPDQAWRQKLTELRPLAASVLAALPPSGLPEEAIRRDKVMVQGCIALIDRSLAQGLPTGPELQGALRTFTPTLLADAAAAGRMEVDDIDRGVRPWWESLSQAQRDRTMVLVLGHKMPRAGNVGYGYFINLLGAAEDGHRVVYAEGVFDDKGADALLSTLATDRRLAVDFFADERRMERDLLADGGEARLLELFGRLGKP
jgi:hypothetical protein